MGARDGRSLAERGEVDVVVVGAGLAGLAAAATAAREGARVLVVEARSEPGGRARSDRVAGHVLNHGPHALYRSGAGAAVLGALGVTYRGSRPTLRGAGWWIGGRRAPAREVSAMGGGSAVGALRSLTAGARRPPAPGEVDLATWLDGHVTDRARPLAESLVRTATYVADLTCLDAAAGLAQLRRAAAGVVYLDGGWATLVAGLYAVAAAAGVTVTTDRVEAVRLRDGLVEVVRRDGPAVTVPAVVVAVGGAASVASLLDGGAPSLSRWADRARPVLAACLDVAVAPAGSRRPVATYGLDEPVYLVDHAASARLAEAGGSTLHALYYEPDRRPEVDHRAVLEQVLDAQDPGWRDRVRHVAYRRRLVVAHDRPRPEHLGGAPTPVAVADRPGVFVAGDWLTDHGLLADAALSSGAAAGRAAAGVGVPASDPVAGLAAGVAG